MNLNDITLCILHDTLLWILRALDDICILQTNLLTRTKTEELLWGILHEVVTLYPKVAREGYLVSSAILVLWIIYSRKLLCLAFRIVGNDELDRINNSTYTSCTSVKILTDSAFHKSHLVKGIKCSIAYLINKLQNSLWRVASATEAAYCRHTRIIPTGNNTFLHEHKKITL